MLMLHVLSFVMSTWCGFFDTISCVCASFDGFWSCLLAVHCPHPAVSPSTPLSETNTVSADIITHSFLKVE